MHASNNHILQISSKRATAPIQLDQKMTKDFFDQQSEDLLNEPMSPEVADGASPGKKSKVFLVFSCYNEKKSL
jgi:hypothetical protein